jgi:prepilin signal peptidase PulO-like enzyme (type II secretory pathway)
MWDTAFFLLLGVVVGSFLNVVVMRMKNAGAPFWQGRSHCPHCNKVLRWFELMPVLSYLLQQGRCHSCKARLSVQYVVMEVLTAAVFFGVYLHLASMQGAYTLWWWVLLATHLVFWSSALVLAAYDAQTTYMPDALNSTAALAALAGVGVQVGLGVFSVQDALTHILMGAALFVPFWVLWRISNGRWIGLGDGKFAISMGFLLGMWGGISAVMYAFWLGAVVALSFMGLQRIAQHCGWKKIGARLTWGSEIPFGPFLVIATAVVYITGSTILSLTGVVW